MAKTTPIEIHLADFDHVAAVIRRHQKLTSRLQQKVRTIANRTPGKGRIWHLDRIADELEIWTDESDADWTDEVLFLRRLVYDLHALRDAVRGNPRKGTLSRNDPDAWREENRP